MANAEKSRQNPTGFFRLSTFLCLLLLNDDGVRDCHKNWEQGDMQSSLFLSSFVFVGCIRRPLVLAFDDLSTCWRFLGGLTVEFPADTVESVI
jgi:hypothetical protein